MFIHSLNGFLPVAHYMYNIHKQWRCLNKMYFFIKSGNVTTFKSKRASECQLLISEKASSYLHTWSYSGGSSSRCEPLQSSILDLTLACNLRSQCHWHFRIVHFAALHACAIDSAVNVYNCAHIIMRTTIVTCMVLALCLGTKVPRTELRLEQRQ